MTPADESKFAEIIVGLSSLKPGNPLTKEGIELFWLSMQDWSLQEFQAAAVHLNRTCQFMPNPFHFEELRKAGKPSAGEAFSVARQAVKNAMPSDLPSLSCGDELVDAAVRACGGYTALAMVESDKIGFFERRFAEHYAAAVDTDQVRTALPFVEVTRLEGPRRFVAIR